MSEALNESLGIRIVVLKEFNIGAVKREFSVRVEGPLLKLLSQYLQRIVKMNTSV